MRALDSCPSLDASEKKNKKEFKLRTLTVLAASCSFKSECQNSSSHYRELQIQAPALIQVKMKTKRKFKLLTLTGPVASCSFKKECQNSSFSY
jgi:hypothetical protein